MGADHHAYKFMSSYYIPYEVQTFASEDEDNFHSEHTHIEKWRSPKLMCMLSTENLSLLMKWTHQAINSDHISSPLQKPIFTTWITDSIHLHTYLGRSFKTTRRKLSICSLVRNDVWFERVKPRNTKLIVSAEALNVKTTNKCGWPPPPPHPSSLSSSSSSSSSSSGNQGCRSGESTRLQPLWSRFIPGPDTISELSMCWFSTLLFFGFSGFPLSAKGHTWTV